MTTAYVPPIEEQNDHHLGFPRKENEYTLHQHPMLGWIREYPSDGDGGDLRLPIEDLAPEVAGTARATAATIKALELAKAGVR